MKRISFLLVAIVCFALAALLAAPLVFAAEEAATPVSGALTTALVNTVFPILGALVLALLGMALRWAGKKWKIEALQGDQEWLRNAAWDAVAYVEELAAKQIKSKEITLSSNQKLDLAVAKVLESSPKVSRERAEQLIESALALAKGAGATGERVLQ